MNNNEIEVCYKPVSELEPYVNNSRTHSDEQVKQIAASISEFGFTNPILVDEHGGIIAGHGRLMAANELGLERVPTIALSGLTDEQKRAYVIADNKIALNSGWDDELLAVEIEELQATDFNIELLGFDDLELMSLNTDDDDFLFDEGDGEDKKEEKQKTKTDDGHCEFALVMTIENKKILTKAINQAKSGLSTDSHECALMEIVKVYAKNS